VSIPSSQIQSNAKNPDVVPGRVDIAMLSVNVSRHWSAKIDWLISFRHHPRTRVIQYSRAFPFITPALQYWVARSKPGDDDGYALSFSRQVFARGFTISFALKTKKAQGRPGARCTRGLVCGEAQKQLHTSIQVKRRHPAFPAQWLYGLYRALPGERALLPPSLPRSVSSSKA
jgi:hypothetical protein